MDNTLDKTSIYELFKRDIVSFLKYKKTAQALPKNAEKTAEFLGYESSSPFFKNHPEVSPENFLTFFNALRDNAALFDKFETGSDGLIVQLNNLAAFGKTYINFIGTLSAQMNRLDIVTENLTAPSERDKQKFEILSNAFISNKNKAITFSAQAKNLLLTAKEFQKGLRGSVIAFIDNSDKRLKSLEAAETVIKTRAEINLINQKINKLTAGYEKNAEADSAGIYSECAEKLRLEIDEFESEYRKQLALYSENISIATAIAKAIEITAGNIHSLDISVINIIANLHSVINLWNNTALEIEKNAAQIIAISSKEDFVGYFIAVSESAETWKKITEIAAGLNKALREIHAVYKS
ncbi:MAG: hypothetical protein LBL87_00525 [Ruminococcus sp.]|jgi:hypothetical protein|nr:hypothetical protein [Ruminococcus sp.]